MITIIDYQTGNLRSISNMLRIIGVSSVISGDASVIEKADKIILPGVGHFDYGMNKLKELKLIELLTDLATVRKIPCLGICLGAQLLTRRSDEGVENGLGWIDAETVAFDRSKLDSRLRIPHMGWSDTEYRSDEPLFAGYSDPPRFYYVHSFHLVCDRPENEICHAIHGYRFCSGIRNENISGVQFHPEKSHRFGKVILQNFADL